MGNETVEAPLEPWAISEDGYPASPDAREGFASFSATRSLAPSGHNTQPWLFRMRDRAVELYADRTRALPVVDPDDRALVISCGAALVTLRIAARQFGERAVVELAPERRDEDLLARVRLQHAEPPSEEEQELFRAIPERHSNRQAFENRHLPGELTERLVADAEAEGGWLHVASDQRGRTVGVAAPELQPPRKARPLSLTK